MLPPMAAPATIDWSALSFASREIVGQIVLRLAAGYSAAEIAQMLTEARPKLKYHELPAGEVRKEWVSARLRELRREIMENAQV
ncbi:hypothetical protein BH18ACT13_BH18ACT13_13590 [soil metagenome]